MALHLQLAAFGPAGGLVVVPRIAQQKARLRAVHDEAQVAPHSGRPEVPVFRVFEPVQLHARIRRVHLQVKGRGFDELLLLAGQAGKAVGEGVGDAEVHGQPVIA
jgi:hypothetical protein